MKHEDAVTIAGIISDIIVSRKGQGQSLFPEGKDGTPSNLGVIWIDQIMKVPDQETEMATRAAIDLMAYTTTAPMPTDFHSMLRKIKRDARMAMPGLPEAEFARELPAWVKGWMIAFTRSDTRAWPEQKPGADYLQRSNPFYRTYVWSEQEMMPEEDRLRYMDEGRNLTTDDFQRLFLEAKVVSTI